MRSSYPYFPTLFALSIAACVGASVGCRNAAYTDLYAESMAAEIRDLEDQVYAFDNECYELEQRVEALQLENERLRQSLNNPAPESLGSRLFKGNGQSPQALPSGPKPAPVPNPGDAGSASSALREQSLESNSILEAPGSSDAAREKELNGNLNELPPKKTPDPVTPDTDMPSIDPGTPMPPGMPVLKTSGTDRSSNSRRSVNAAEPMDNSMELSLGKIEIPGQLASTASNESRRGQLLVGVEKPADTRIVEIAFHPILCRAANLDDESDDDGLYLVLQPVNERGELVPTYAQLEVSLIDPSRRGDEAKIGSWKLSPTEVKSKFKPTGSDQGIHLMLPWNGPDPAADRVVVFAYYTLADGRQVVNDKTIFVAGKNANKTVWVPRVTNGTNVIPASHEQAAPNSSATGVVRPTQGSLDPAPKPILR